MRRSSVSKHLAKRLQIIYIFFLFFTFTLWKPYTNNISNVKTNIWSCFWKLSAHKDTVISKDWEIIILTKEYPRKTESYRDCKRLCEEMVGKRRAGRRPVTPTWPGQQGLGPTRGQPSPPEEQTLVQGCTGSWSWPKKCFWFWFTITWKLILFKWLIL